MGVTKKFGLGAGGRSRPNLGHFVGELVLSQRCLYKFPLQPTL